MTKMGESLRIELKVNKIEEKQIKKGEIHRISTLNYYI